MNFLDSLSIFVQGGHGGAGAKTFRTEKYVPKGGPDGGDGGSGGDVVVVADANINNFLDIKNKKRYSAKAGKNGLGGRKSGTKGADVIIRVPCGTAVYSESGELMGDLVDDNQSLVVAKGGKGGRGNANFATSRVQSPLYAQPGLPPESSKIQLELRTIADVGLIGPPNAGKSSLLNQLTHTNSKVGDYAFTTKSPNLGIIRYIDRHITVADIPGLIEGASVGRGLGNQFLKHVSRTQFHLIVVTCGVDLEETIQNYHAIIHELDASQESLQNTPRQFVLSKRDLVSEEQLLTYIQYFQSHSLPVVATSCVTQLGIDELKTVIYNHFTKGPVNG